LQSVFKLQRYPTFPEGFNSVVLEVEIDQLDVPPRALEGRRTLRAWPISIAVHQPPLTAAPSWKANLGLTASAQQVDDFIECCYELHHAGDPVEVT
jgi:hypothetical protein